MPADSQKGARSGDASGRPSGRWEGLASGPDPVTLRRAELLACLRAAGEEPVSGQDLADQLHVSRTAVSKHIAALRKLGYEVESAPRRGYRLVASPDLPLPVEVLPRLAGRFGHLVGGDTTGSTNDDAKALAESGAPEGTVVLAARQTKGRGRMGRVWQSPEGGLYVSYVLRPPVAPSQVASLSLVVALAVADSLARLGVGGVSLKWPNDVLLDVPAGTDGGDGGRDGQDGPSGQPAYTGKVTGILLEMAAQVEQVLYVVPGLGLNVMRPAGADIAITDGGRRPAAYLSDVLDRVPSLAEVAAAQVDCVASRYDAWLAAGCSFAPFRDEYQARLAILGQDVHVSTMDGTRLAQGIVMGVDDEGRLLVRDEEGVVTPVIAGEVTLR